MLIADLGGSAGDKNFNHPAEGPELFYSNIEVTFAIEFVMRVE